MEPGNIEDADVGSGEYDVIIASSTFEHVERWEEGIGKVFNALKPGGLFYFLSTNKFSIVSGEYRVPFYGWLPDGWRSRFRAARQGEDIMKRGLDYNQFTYFRLRGFFKKLGFSRVLDRIDLTDTDAVSSFAVRNIVRVVRRFGLLKEAALLFTRCTFFICIK
ncbi:MAG: methyltransferase domain-containing protein [bacterium]